MNIYAIYDSLMEFWRQPFAANHEKEVMTSVASAINNLENNSDIAQAPHHFELWQLGRVTQDGHLEEDRYKICRCDSLIRGNVRPGGIPGGPKNAPAAPIGDGAPQAARGPDRTEKRPAGLQAPPEASEVSTSRHPPR